MGFDPYRRIRRARRTRRGDLVFLASFLLILAGLVIWAMW